MKMKKIYGNIGSVLLGGGVFLFWWLCHPFVLGLQEQNQLFLFTWDYLWERLSLSGGLADWIAEFITQFNYIPWLGALLLAAVFVLLQKSVKLACGKGNWEVLSFLPPAVLLIYMGDHYVMLCFAVALIIASLLCALYRRYPNPVWAAMAIVTGYWLIGPAIYIFALFAAIRDKKWTSLLYLALTVATVVGARLTYLQQYPWKSVVNGINYYRMALEVPALQVVTAGITLIIPLVAGILPKPKATLNAIMAAGIVILAVFGVRSSFDKDTYETIAYDQLVRQEKWGELIKRAEKRQPRSELQCVGLNLALFMEGRMNEMPRFKQYGTRGLIMPNVRDYISNASSAEVFWRLGFVNESLRYAFDTQESLVNNRKSGRWMSRMAEAQIVNGRYAVAEKYLDILSHSLFYRNWANDRRRYLNNDEAVNADKVYSYLKAVRLQEDFLFYYPEMDKMLGKLYFTNQNNTMAAWYYQAWTVFMQKEERHEETDTYSVHGS